MTCKWCHEFNPPNRKDGFCSDICKEHWGRAFGGKKDDPDRTIWHLVADLREPDSEPFAVMRVDTSVCREGGVEGTVISLHWTREEAEEHASGLDEECRISALTSHDGKNP
jgi:hypothetical protein